MWELDHKESWAQKNWCFWTVVLEKTLESPLDSKEIQPVHPKGNLSWTFIGRTDAEAETSILWLPDAKKWLTGKDPDAEKDWRREEKGPTGDEIAGWHHRLNGQEFELMSKLRELVKGREAWRAAVHGVAKSWMQPTERLSWAKLVVRGSPSPSPILPLLLSLSLATTSLVSVNLFFLLYSLVCYIFQIPHMWCHTVFVFLWLISLSIIPCKSIHVVANGKISFSFFWTVVYIYTTSSLSTHLLMNI